MAEFLLLLLTALLLGYLFGEVSHRFGVPRVVGQIVAGVVLGVPAIQSYFFDESTKQVFSLLASVGSILLFFFVGLEVNLREFRENLRKSFLISLFNTSIPLAAGFLLMRALGFNEVSALVTGIALSVSSAAASINFLEELGMLKSRIGSLIITAGTVDDVVELALIGAVLAVFQSSLTSYTPGGFIVGTALFILLIGVFRLFIIPRALAFFEHDTSKTELFTGALLITLLMAVLGQSLGIGSLIGAFLSGVFIRHVLVSGPNRRPWEEHALTHSIHTLAFGFFVPVLFVWVGYQVNLDVTADNLFLGGLLTTVAVVGTIAGTILGVRIMQGTLKEGFIVGWGVTSKGDVELVISALALQGGLISAGLFNAIVFTSILTTLISPIVFRYLIRRHHAKEIQVTNKNIVQKDAKTRNSKRRKYKG